MYSLYVTASPLNMAGSGVTPDVRLGLLQHLFLVECELLETSHKVQLGADSF